MSGEGAAQPHGREASVEAEIPLEQEEPGRGPEADGSAGCGRVTGVASDGVLSPLCGRGPETDPEGPADAAVTGEVDAPCPEKRDRRSRSPPAKESPSCGVEPGLPIDRPESPGHRSECRPHVPDHGRDACEPTVSDGGEPQPVGEP